MGKIIRESGPWVKKKEKGAHAHEKKGKRSMGKMKGKVVYA